MVCYIYQLPSWVLDDLCRNIDTLSEWDWMQFGECDTAYSPPGPAIRCDHPCYLRPGVGVGAWGCLFRTLGLCFNFRTDLDGWL